MGRPTIRDLAAAASVSVATVNRRWAVAKSWLVTELTRPA